MDEDSTLIQLTHLLSGIMRRINDIPLDKDAKSRFIKLEPEQRAETCRVAEQPLGEMENLCVTKTLSCSTSSLSS